MRPECRELHEPCRSAERIRVLLGLVGDMGTGRIDAKHHSRACSRWTAGAQLWPESMELLKACSLKGAVASSRHDVVNVKARRMMSCEAIVYIL
jgi:hypothetical protein